MIQRRELGRCSRRKSVTAFISQIFNLKDMDPLKKELEEELKLNTEDPRGHAWYHGPITREGAEQLLDRDGDFLVRDSSSSTGDYVLSCMWRNQHMHFKIIRIMLRPKQGYSRELFQFENDQFDNVPALIRFHVGGRRPISNSTGAIIFHPITRSVPLRIIRERQTTGSQLSRGQSKRRSLSSSQANTLLVNNNLLRSGSQPANLETVGRPSLQAAQSDSNIRTGVKTQTSPIQESGPAPVSPVFRTGSEPLLSPAPSCAAPSGVSSLGGSSLHGSDGQLHSRAPPKPLRISTIFSQNSVEMEPDNGDIYGELVPQGPVSMLPNGHVARLRAQEKWNTRARLTDTSFGFLEAQRLTEELPQQEIEDLLDNKDWHFERPQTESTSCFRLDDFRSLILPENNRPLDQNVLLKVKELLTRTDTRITALHLLSVNCQVARVTGVTVEQKRIMGVQTGLELITLPHGGQLRQDLLERHHVLALGIAVDLLGCTGTVSQRASVLHKIIQLAKELRDHTHDLYAFSAVMKALELPQVVRLEMTWRMLRRNHTDTAVAFEKSLKPFMKSLNEGNDAVVSGPLSLPHMVPLLRLMEGNDDVETSDRGCQLLYNLLQSARNATLHSSDCTQHAHGLLSAGWEPIPELLEVFQTEFALRLLWGSAGSRAEQTERYAKFDRILGVLSNKLEPDQTSEV